MEPSGTKGGTKANLPPVLCGLSIQVSWNRMYSSGTKGGTKAKLAHVLSDTSV